MKVKHWIISLICGFTLLFHGCNSEPFPIGGDQNAGFQVPLVPTYTFNFKTGSGAITGEQGNLKIVSGADIKNLIVATPGISEQSSDRGVISGIVVDELGRSLSSVSIGTLDKAGRIVRNVDGTVTAAITNDKGDVVAEVLYNSINGVPEFVNTAGTSVSGSFTALNVPPGEHFIKAVQGGRGNTRVNVFAGSLSLIDLKVFPVTLPVVNITGVVRGRDGLTAVGQTGITFAGVGGQLTTGAASAFSLSGLGAESTFLVKTGAEGHVDTYEEMFTDLGTLTVISVTPQITKNFTTVSTPDFQAMVAATGASAIPSRGALFGKAVELNGKKREVTVFVTDSGGNAIGEVYYFPSGSDLPVCNDANIGTCLTKTSTAGQFLILNLPPGLVFIKAYAEVASEEVLGETIKSTGTLVTSVFADAIKLNDIGLQMTLREDPNATSPPKPPTWYSMALSGTVREDDRVTPVQSVDISILGQAGIQSTSDATVGDYRISAGTTPTDILPLLTNSISLFLLEKTGYTPTYQTVLTGGQDRFLDLSIIPDTVLNPALGTGAVMGRLINRRLGGSINEVQVIATAGIDSETQIVTTGVPVGTVSYFDDSGIEDPAATATSNNGRFIIRNLPPGLVVIKTSSSDDSGNRAVTIFEDGVSLVEMSINHVAINVPVTGAVSDLKNNAVTGATLSLLGEGIDFTSESLSTSPGVLVPAFGSYVTKLVKTGVSETFIDTYNYQLRTGLEAQTGANFFIATLSDLTNFANQGGLTLDMGRGIVSGQVLEKLFIAQATPIATGSGPRGIISGLFNEDPFLDLAVTHTSPDEVQIFLGQPGGVFGPVPDSTIAVGANPSSVDVGDFNQDGYTDLVVSNRDADSLSLLFGTGDGQFIAPVGAQITTSQGIGTSPVFVKAVDLNVDGKLDLAIVNEGSDSLSVLMGDGSSGFTSADSPCPTPCAMRETPLFTTAADFDSDGQLDLATAGTGSTVVQLLLSGEGVPSNFVTAGAAPRAVETGDINGDGRADLVVLNSGADTYSSFLGDGNGVFVKIDCMPGPDPVLDITDEDCVLPSGSIPSALLLADFDEDGRLDLLIANEGLATVSLFPGIGNGYFDVASRSFNVGASPSRLISGDFNLDGRDDVIALNTGSDNFTVILSGVSPVKDVVIEVRDEAGRAAGILHYIDNNIDVDPTLTKTSDSGRFIIFDLPFGLNVIKGTREAATGIAPLIGNTLINITEFGTLTHTDLRLEVGLPASVVAEGVTCRVVGEVCTTVGRAQIAILGTETESICPPGPDCISQVERASYTLTLDPHSTYVIQILGPDAVLPGDSDGDGVLDTIDNCQNTPNAEQIDENNNRIGDKCENFIEDRDDDGIGDLQDNCPDVPNPGQQDDDQNAIGNACDPNFGKPSATKASEP